MADSLISVNEASLQKMIDVINEFPLSAEFFYWFAKEDLVCRVISENIYANVYDRINQYYIDGKKIYTGGWQVLLNKVSERLLLLLTSKRKHLFDFLEEFHHLDKKKSHDTLINSTYTMFSQIFYKGEYCGSKWEIYYLPHLIESYSERSSFLESPF